MQISDKRLISKIYKELMQLNYTAKKAPKNPVKKWAEKMSRLFFFNEDIQMANCYLKRHPASSIISEMQIKATMRYHFTPVRMDIIKKTEEKMCWKRY